MAPLRASAQSGLHDHTLQAESAVQSREGVSVTVVLTTKTCSLTSEARHLHDLYQSGHMNRFTPCIYVHHVYNYTMKDVRIYLHHEEYVYASRTWRIYVCTYTMQDTWMYLRSIYVYIYTMKKVYTRSTVSGRTRLGREQKASGPSRYGPHNIRASMPSAMERGREGERARGREGERARGREGETSVHECHLNVSHLHRLETHQEGKCS